jgi:hypothetical protein
MWPFKSGLMVMIEVLVGRAVGCQSSGISQWRPFGDGGTDDDVTRWQDLYPLQLFAPAWAPSRQRRP